MRVMLPLRPALGSAMALALAAAGLVVAVPGPAHALDGDDCTSINQVDTVSENEVTDVAADGSPVQALHIEAAQRRVRELTGRTPGAGVSVAVLDSGVRPQPGLTVQAVEPAPGATSTRELVWHQGTMLAGVIAAGPDPDTGLPVGIAPGATIVDQRIYDTASESDDGLTRLGPEAVAAGLEAIAPLVGPRGVSIITVGVSNPDTPRLRAAVDLVTGKGAIIVAATAPRPPAESGAPGATYRPGEDYADAAFPAGYATTDPLVLSVATTGASGEGEELDPSPYLLYSSAIDVAVPTAGAVSLALNDSLCTVSTPSTAVAAAEVAGILALLRTAFPADRPAQLVARLEATASGAARVDPAIPNTREGRGVVQPLEALTRPLAPARDGVLPADGLAEQDRAPAVLPVESPDVLASTRENAVWWGIFGGGALVVLVLLRPVLSRRRDS